MDLFKKGSLKSQSLNSRFLSSNSQSNGQTTRSLPVQPVKPPPPSLLSTNSQNSKLKLTTSRTSSSLRLSRDQTSSPGLHDQASTISKESHVEKKAPVWNKGLPSKPTKDFTDDELKAMHGISLVSRNSNPAGVNKEGRWDDSDEDDDWGDTIDFGDGTKVTIGQTALPAMPREVPVATEPIVSRAQEPPRDANSPWKKSDIDSVRSLASHDFPPVSAASQPSVDAFSRDSRVQQEHVLNNIKDNPDFHPPSAAMANDGTRARSGSFNKDGRSLPSGDARYQYDQNTYDRRWQNPPPQTREIYNSATGRFEQIDSSKTTRRPSHHDRRSAELLPRGSSSPLELKRAIAPAYAIGKNNEINDNSKSVEDHPKPDSNHESVQGAKFEVREVPTPVPVNDPTLAVSASAEIDKTSPLDPSSKEFIDMQKTLMAERREQAIQRRKTQEAEEAARKERARKKAEELAIVAEKAEEERRAEKAAELLASQPTKVKVLTKNVERRPVQSADLEVQSRQTLKSLPKTLIDQVPSKRPDPQARQDSMWQRGSKETALPEASQSQRSGNVKVFSRADNLGSVSPPSSDLALGPQELSKDTLEKNHKNSAKNVWGPIGSKNSPGGPVQIAASQLNKSNTRARRVSDISSAPIDNSSIRPQQADRPIPSWTAFDGISRPRKGSSAEKEPREYNVFDASDEVFTPERSRHSPPGQSQASRTSSRFFPSQATSLPSPIQPRLPFVSPLLPPRIDSVQHVHYESADSAPKLSLPEAAVDSSNGPSRSIDRVMMSIKKTMQPVHTKLGKYGGRAFGDVQTRTVWEIKPLRSDQSPRVRVPWSEKVLDWTRKPTTPGNVLSTAPVLPVQQNGTPPPAMPAWSLPKTLEVLSKTSNISEPLIPPPPAVKLPAKGEDGSLRPPLHTKRGLSRADQDRFKRFHTTKPAITEEADNMSPIRIKTSIAEAKISRRFGKRLEATQTKKVSDVKRQPVNMSDAPGGTGFKRGFSNRQRVESHSHTRPQESTAGIDEGSTERQSLLEDNLTMGPSSVTIMQRQSHPEAARTSPMATSVSEYVLPDQDRHQSIAQPKIFGTTNSSSILSGAMPSRIAPPGLSVPPALHGDALSSANIVHNNSASLVAPSARRPPGINLP